MYSSKLTKIDGDKLKAALKTHKLNSMTVSAGLGYSKNFISTACSRGSMAKSAVRTLEVIYGIKYEEYKPTEELGSVNETSEVPTNVNVNFDIDKLYNVIYSATYKAFKDALNGENHGT